MIFEKNFPSIFLEKIAKIYPKLDLSNAFTKDYPIIFRIIPPYDIFQIPLTNEQVTKVAGFENVYKLTNQLDSNANKILDELFQKNIIYFQSLPSLLVSKILSPSKTDKILDLCASPGSKASHLASLLGSPAFLTANEPSTPRRYKLKRILASMGLRDVKVTSHDGRSAWKYFGGEFDIVLCDAPCSGEGLFDIKDPKTYEGWSQKKVKNLAKLQKWLLMSAYSCTRPNGKFLYSTCTISPEENEEVISWFLERIKGKAELLPIDSNIFSAYNNDVFGLSYEPAKHNIAGYQSNMPIANAIRILPSSKSIGFFYAYFHKLG